MVRFKFSNADAYEAAYEDLITEEKIQEIARYYMTVHGLQEISLADYFFVCPACRRGRLDKVTRSWSFRTGLFPTQDLVDCYLQKDEADGKWKHWWETKQARDLNIAVTTDKDGKWYHSS